MASLQRIAIMSGVFDPPTLAHERLLRAALRRLKPDRLYVVVVGHPDDRSPAQLPVEARLTLARHAFEPLDEQRVVVSDLQALREPPLLADTVADIISVHPNAHLSLVMGADQLLRFCDLRHWPLIAHRAALAVAARPQRVADGRLAAQIDLLRRMQATVISLPLALSDDGSAAAARAALQQGDWAQLRRHVPARTVNALRAFH